MSACVTSPSFWERRMVDDAVRAYVEWREESSTVWTAYILWADAAAADAGVAHAAYHAALDREEAAAHAYASLIECVTELVQTGFEYALGSRGSA